MKKTVNRKALLDICQRLKSYISNKQIVPILGCYLIDGNKITVDNQETRLTEELPWEHSEGFSFCVPAALFSGALSALQTDEVTLSITENQLTIASPSVKKNIKITTFPSEDFWKPKTAEGDTFYLPIPSKHFMEAIKTATKFLVTDAVDFRAFVGISVRNEKLYINGGGGHSTYQTEISIPGIKTFSALISTQGANALSEVTGEDLTLEKRGNFLLLKNDTLSVQVRCMEGIWKPIDFFTNKSNPPFTKVDTQEFLSACNICGLVKDPQGESFIKICKLDNGLEFTADEESASTKSFIECDTKGWMEDTFYQVPLVKKALSSLSQDNCLLDGKVNNWLFIYPSEEKVGIKEVFIIGGTLR